MIDLNQRAAEVHKLNHKWWHDLDTGERLERNKGEFLMLVISELAECMEYERKGGYDKHLPHRLGAEVEMADAYIRLLDYAGGYNIPISDGILGDKDGMIDLANSAPSNKGEFLFAISSTVGQTLRKHHEEDMINFAIGLVYAYCHKFGYDLEGAYQEKLAYNQTRKDHTKEARQAEGGKKW